MFSEGYKIIIVLVSLCLLLGWDLGLLVSNKWYKEKYSQQEKYIEQLEMRIDDDTLRNIKEEIRK